MPTQLLQITTTPDLADRVHRALLDAINDGSLAPGQRITQEELAEQLAVSRQPVMQALRMLKKDGFVQDAPGRGLQVTPLDPVRLSQVYEVRGTLDALAARRAAERRIRLDPALISSGRDAVASGDLRAMIDADLAFHRALYQAAGNPLIEQSALLHWQHIRRAMGAALQSSDLREPVWDEHEAIAQAVAEGDGEAAAASMLQHSRQASTYLVARLSAGHGRAPEKDNSVVL